MSFSKLESKRGTSVIQESRVDVAQVKVQAGAYIATVRKGGRSDSCHLVHV